MFTYLKTVMILLLLLLLIAPVQAQDDLQQVTAENGSFSFSLPADWITVDTGSVIIAGTSEAALASLDTSDPVPAGEGVIVVMGPAFFAEQFGIASDDTLGRAVQVVLAEMQDDENWPDFGEIQYDELPDGRNLVGVEALADSPLDGAFAVIDSAGGGVLGALIITPAGDVDQYKDIYLEMFQSLRGGVEGAQSTQTEQITAADGSFSFSLPSDWLTVDTGSVIIAGTGEGAIESVSTSTAVPAGEALIVVMGPAFFTGQFDIAPTVPLPDVLQTLLDEMGEDDNWPDFADIQTVDLPDGRQLAGVEALDDSPLDGALAVINSEGGGFLGALIVTPAGDVDQYEDVYFAMLQSLHGRATGASAPVPAGNGELIEQWASAATGTSEYTATDWGFIQATGGPDTKGCNDLVTAWASATATGADMLVLTFDQAVYPTQVNIRQTLDPGAIYLVELHNSATDQFFTIPNSADPPGNTPCPGNFTLDIEHVTTPVDEVIIYLDQSITGTWNEIDAVQLIGTLTLPEPTAPVKGQAVTTEETITEEPTTPVKGATTGQTEETTETTTEEITSDERFEVLLHEDGLFGIDTVPGWTFGTIDGIVEIGSASGMGSVIDVIAPPAGEVFIQIFPPEILSMTAMMPPPTGDNRPEAAIERFANWKDMEGLTTIPYNYTESPGVIVALPAAALEPALADLLLTYNFIAGGGYPEILARPTPESGDAALIAFEKGEALFLVAVYSDRASQEAQVGALLDSITLGQDAAPDTGNTTEEVAEEPVEDTVEEPATTGERFELALHNDGLFAISTAPDWAFGTVDGIIEINSAPSSGSIPADIIPVAGEVFIQIVPPEILTMMGIAPTEGDNQAAQLVEQFVAWRNLEEQATAAYNHTDPPGALVEMPAPTLEPAIAILLLNYSLLTDGDTPTLSDRPTPESGDAVLIGLEKDGALFLVAVYGDLASQEAQVGALLDSITLQGE